MFRLYNGFPNYDVFSHVMVVRFLGRNAASQLVYSNTEQNNAKKKWKNGPKRTLSVEDIWQRLPSKLQNGLQTLAARGLKTPSEKCLTCLRKVAVFKYLYLIYILVSMPKTKYYHEKFCLFIYLFLHIE